MDKLIVGIVTAVLAVAATLLFSHYATAPAAAPAVAAPVQPGSDRAYITWRAREVVVIDTTNVPPKPAQHCVVVPVEPEPVTVDDTWCRTWKGAASDIFKFASETCSPKQ